MFAHFRSVLIRRTVLAGTAITVAMAGAGGAYMHLAASPSPSGAAGSAAPRAAHAHHHHRGPRLLHALVRDTARKTGQTPEQVVTALKAGKTIDQIAGSKAATVKQDILAAAKTRLDGAVSRGRIDAAKEKTMLDKLSSQLDTLMNKNVAAEVQHLGKRHAAGPGLAPAPPASAASPAV